MDYGVILPHVGAYAREHVVDRLQTVARHAESLGYNSLWVADHVVFPTELKSKYPYHPEGKFPFDPADNFLEPLTVLGYVAACTTTIRLGAGVGWLEEEFAFLDSPYHQRGARTDEYLQAMKALWTQPQAQFHGRHVNFSDVRCEPKPVQKPHPPIWTGGHSPAALRRTAKLADGWYGHVFWRNPEALPQEIRTIKQMVEQAGRDPRSLTYAALAYERTFEDAVRNIPHYQQVGLDHVVLAFFGWTEGFDEVLKLMDRFAREAGLPSQ